LRAQGVDARIDDDVEEFRSLGHAAVEVGICVADNVVAPAAGTAMLELIRRAAVKTISKRKSARRTQRPRRLPIYGSGGRIHGYIDLPAEDDDNRE
jgi:hypothetical protein